MFKAIVVPGFLVAKYPSSSAKYNARIQKHTEGKREGEKGGTEGERGGRWGKRWIPSFTNPHVSHLSADGGAMYKALFNMSNSSDVTNLLTY